MQAERGTSVVIGLFGAKSTKGKKETSVEEQTVVVVVYRLSR